MQEDPWPTELRVSADRRSLSVTFDDGNRVELASELLRIESPSAEVQGHAPGEKVLVSGKSDVEITALEPVGTYAVRLLFSDGHRTGIYSWRQLREFGRRAEDLMRNYLAALTERGLSR